MAAGDNVIVRAFTEEQAAKLTALTVHMLRNWDRTRFFVPEFAARDRRTPYSRIYSFLDLLSLQVLKVLRLDMGCSLQHLRGVKADLARLGDKGWARTTLYVLNRKVVLHDDEKRSLREAVSGQLVLQIPLHVVRTNMEAAVVNFNRRSPSEIGLIEQRRNVNHNQPVLKGTRIPVSAIQRFSEDGYSVDQILAEYPSLTKTDIEEALKYSPTRRSAA